MKKFGLWEQSETSNLILLSQLVLGTCLFGSVGYFEQSFLVTNIENSDLSKQSKLELRESWPYSNSWGFMHINRSGGREHTSLVEKLTEKERKLGRECGSPLSCNLCHSVPIRKVTLPVGRRESERWRKYSSLVLPWQDESLAKFLSYGRNMGKKKNFSQFL